MPIQGRSADDLPLAAYSTGVDPETEPAIDPPATANVAPSPAAPRVAPPRAAAPAFTRSPGEPPADPFGQAAPARAAVATPAAQPPFLEVLRNPRGNARDPRLLLSGVVAIGLVLLVVSLLGGGAAKGQATALESPGAGGGAVATAAPAGAVNVEFTGAFSGTFDLTGMTGTGRPSGTTMASTWGDSAGDALALGGPVSAGTRATDSGFVLSWTVMIKGQAVKFTSSAGECVIGMAVKMTTVSGSFTCHQVKSADGKLLVSASGTYRT